MRKNQAGQKLKVFAFNRTDNTPVTGDAANITAKISLDYGTRTAITDTNPTEAEDGFYYFDLTAAETNADVIDAFPESATADVQVIAVPGTIYTQVDVSPVVSPLSSTTPTRVTGTTIQMFVGETTPVRTRVLDSDDAAVDLSSKTLRFVVEDTSTNTDILVVEDASISVDGADNSYFTITPNTASTATVATGDDAHIWSLRDTADGDRVLARGKWVVSLAALKD